MKRRPIDYHFIESAALRLDVSPDVARAMALLAQLPYEDQHRIIMEIFGTWFENKTPCPASTPDRALSKG